MKKLLLTALFACGIVAGIEAAPTDNVTQADLQAILTRLAKLEAENKAQAEKIRELEGRDAALVKKVEVAEQKVAQASAGALVFDEGTTTNESGRVITTKDGFKYYLADASARIFEPLSESGLKITPYGYLVFEGVYNTHGTECDVYSDWVKAKSSKDYDEHTSCFSVQDSILGIQFLTPEAVNGWTFSGKAEFDLAGGNANDYDFHWRHLYVDAQHESGWSILFGQTWHLWKMVTPSEMDGAWMENTGHPYRRSPQIRVTKTWDLDEKSSLEWRVGLVKNGPGMGGDRDDDGTEDNSASAWGLFETALMYSRDAAWEDEGSGKRWLVGFGGMYGQDRSHKVLARDDEGNPTVLGDKEDYDSMMAMFAASVPFGDFTLTGQFFGGENLGGVQAGIGQSVGFEADGSGEEVRTMGGFLDLNYRLNETWEFAVGYGFDNPDDGDAKLAEGRLFNDRAYVDAFYHITSNFKLGLEYGRLSTKYDDGTAYSDRIHFAAFYDF